MQIAEHEECLNWLQSCVGELFPTRDKARDFLDALAPDLHAELHQVLMQREQELHGRVQALASLRRPAQPLWMPVEQGMRLLLPHTATAVSRAATESGLSLDDYWRRAVWAYLDYLGAFARIPFDDARERLRNSLLERMPEGTELLLRIDVKPGKGSAAQKVQSIFWVGFEQVDCLFQRSRLAVDEAVIAPITPLMTDALQALTAADGSSVAYHLQMAMWGYLQAEQVFQRD